MNNSIRKFNLALFVSICYFSNVLAQSNAYKLWYDRPAQVWTEALPLGNGRLGAMVFGNPAAEQIQLNEATIWAGSPNNNPNPEALKAIPEIRQLVFAGKYEEIGRASCRERVYVLV